MALLDSEERKNNVLLNCRSTVFGSNGGDGTLGVSSTSAGEIDFLGRSEEPWACLQL